MPTTASRRTMARPAPARQPRVAVQVPSNYQEPPATPELAQAEQLLQEKFGFPAFREGQRAVIGHLLAGQSAAAVFPTGSGKSLCYQLPALVLPGLTLVVSPLIALMKDQIDRLTQRGVAAARLDSTLNADETAEVNRRLRSGELKLLYVAPERFNNERFRDTLERVTVSLFAVDEAHCISEWGHNFRPDYLKLAGFARRCGAERLLALTATATPSVLADICRGFQIADGCAVRTGFYRPNLTVLFTPVEGRERDAVLSERLTSRPAGPTIVYVTLQKTAEEVAARLAKAGFAARAYHAGLDDEERSAVQDWFLASDRAVVVATIAFGMGIDKSNIRYVYHYNLAKSLENFSQEIGRAGRDGAPATCESLIVADDLTTLENFAYGDTPTRRAVQGLLGEMLEHEGEFDVSEYDLSRGHDIRPLVVKTLSTYLELDGYLESGTPFYARYQFKPLVSSAEILSRFEGERREFLAAVFRCARQAKIWFQLDLLEAAQATGSPRDRVVRALDYLAEEKLLEVKVEGVRQRFRRLKPAASLPSLAESLWRKTIDREVREVARLKQIWELAGHAGCQVSHLGAHFGEPLPESCGHCSWCLNGGKSLTLADRPAAETLDESTLRAGLELARATGAPLDEARSLARLLCGLGSPQFTARKLTAHKLFGSLSAAPFPAVLATLERLQAQTPRK